MSFSTGNIHLNGADLAYLDQGRGAPVIFIHGSFSDHRIWELQRQAVADAYRYIAVDLRYFGTTPWPDEARYFSPQTHVADLVALIEALGLAPVVLVGRSYGSTIALATALRHPALVRGLFLNEPPVLPLPVDAGDAAALAGEFASRDELMDKALQAPPEKALELFADWVHGEPGHFSRLSEAAKRIPLTNARTVPHHLRAPGIAIESAEMARLTCPITITRGALTRPFFKVMAQAVHRSAPTSRLLVIPEARHAVPNEQPLAFNAALLEFLSA